MGVNQVGGQDVRKVTESIMSYDLRSVVKSNSEPGGKSARN